MIPRERRHVITEKVEGVRGERVREREKQQEGRGCMLADLPEHASASVKECPQ